MNTGESLLSAFLNEITNTAQAVSKRVACANKLYTTLGHFEKFVE